MCPLLGTWPATQAGALLGIEPETVWFTGWCSIHWAMPARAIQLFFFFFLMRGYWMCWWRKIFNLLHYFHDAWKRKWKTVVTIRVRPPSCDTNSVEGSIPCSSLLGRGEQSTQTGGLRQHQGAVFHPGGRKSEIQCHPAGLVPSGAAKASVPGPLLTAALCQPLRMSPWVQVCPHLQGVGCSPQGSVCLQTALFVRTPGPLD